MDFLFVFPGRRLVIVSVPSRTAVPRCCVFFRLTSNSGFLASERKRYVGRRLRLLLIWLTTFDVVEFFPRLVVLLK